MDFTREPIIETIITPKDGYKLVVRSSKGVTQEEYFLEAVQIVSYGNAFFFRSTELPKSFLVPVSDYELVEVREARIALKSAAPDRAIKIGGGREASLRSVREPVSREMPIREPIREPAREPMREPVREPAYSKDFERTEYVEKSSFAENSAVSPLAATPSVHDKKRDRRRSSRRRRTDTETEGVEEGYVEENGSVGQSGPIHNNVTTAPSTPAPSYLPEKREFSTSLTSILPPPSKLISDTIHEYRGSELFKDIFHTPTEEVVEDVKPVVEPLLKNEELKSEEVVKSKLVGDEATLPSGLFFAPPPSLAQESVEERDKESLFIREVSDSSPSPSEELGNQQFLFLEVLSQSARGVEEEESIASHAGELDTFRPLELAPVELGEEGREDRFASKNSHEKEVLAQKTVEEEHDAFRSPDQASSSSFWPDSFGHSQRQQRGEDDHPLPL